jgi:hypothetical protein
MAIDIKKALQYAVSLKHILFIESNVTNLIQQFTMEFQNKSSKPKYQTHNTKAYLG